MFVAHEFSSLVSMKITKHLFNMAPISRHIPVMSEQICQENVFKVTSRICVKGQLKRLIENQYFKKHVIFLSGRHQNFCPANRSNFINYNQLRHFSTIKNNCGTDSSQISGSLNKGINESKVMCTVTENSKQNNEVDRDEEDPGFKAVLSAVTPNIPPPTYVDIVPGKGPPPEPPVNCCMSGCANCVWIQYAEELRDYFSENEGNIRAKEAIEKIDNPGLQMFLKLELGLL